MMDYVKAPKAKKTTVGAPYHSFKVSRIKAHVEGGKPRKKQKVHAGILAHCSTLASQDIPFAHPPPQCAFYGTPYSSSSEVKCYRTTCPLLPPIRGRSAPMLTDSGVIQYLNSNCLNKTFCVWLCLYVFRVSRKFVLVSILGYVHNLHSQWQGLDPPG